MTFTSTVACKNSNHSNIKKRNNIIDCKHVMTIQFFLHIDYQIKKIVIFFDIFYVPKLTWDIAVLIFYYWSDLSWKTNRSAMINMATFKSMRKLAAFTSKINNTSFFFIFQYLFKYHISDM